MALRHRGRARLRRAAGGRAGFVALACTLFLLAGLSATWPALQHAGTRFLAGGAPGHGEAAPGDHLQTAYRLWLVGHQVERGAAPWREPYSFRPHESPRVNFAGWPFGLPYWPLSTVFGAVAAWNVFVLATYLLAGTLACAWLRELGLPRGAALCGALAFAIAPYRAMQSAGHLLGPISALLPAALFAWERGRRGHPAWLVLAAAALASIPLSGQVHLALGAVPFFLAYAVCRSRERRALVAAALAVLASVATGLLVQQVAIEGSIASGGRSLKAVAFYSADWLDFVTRHVRHGSERFVFLGWATPLAAAAGLGVLVAARRLGLALVLVLGTLVPIVLSLGTRLPFYSALRTAFPPLRYPRVPERLMPIACLALAALAAFAIARLRFRLAPLLAAALLFADLHVEVYGASAADERNRAYAALRTAPAGRLLELPVFPADRHYGSVYLYYSMQAPRERPAGYSTLAPRRADALLRRLRRLNCGNWGGGARTLLERLGVRYVAFHRALYVRNPLVPGACARRALNALLRQGFAPFARDGPVTMWRHAERSRG